MTLTAGIFYLDGEFVVIMSGDVDHLNNNLRPNQVWRVLPNGWRKGDPVPSFSDLTPHFECVGE